MSYENLIRMLLYKLLYTLNIFIIKIYYSLSITILTKKPFVIQIRLDVIPQENQLHDIESLKNNLLCLHHQSKYTFA